MDKPQDANGGGAYAGIDVATVTATGPAGTAGLTRQAAEDFLIAEARLIDDWALEQWNGLFTDDGVYWIPIDENLPTSGSVSIVHDTPLCREERIFHLTRNSFPAQSPRSRILHFISNVSVQARESDFLVRSNQLIYEMRTGDYRQAGIGELRPIVASVEHVLRRVTAGAHAGELRIALKKVLLINRDAWLGNMTFVL